MLVKWKGTALDRLADIYVAATPAERDEIEATTRRVNAERPKLADPAHETCELNRSAMAGFAAAHG
jgi:hypothetical protein